MHNIWTILQFTDLTPEDLYDLLRLRGDVFVVEQACPYADLDGRDRLPDTRHVWFRAEGGKMAACARILPLEDGEVRIGRVAVAQKLRGRGLAHELVEVALDEARRLWPDLPVRIAAQAYLEDFYRSHGFITVSQVYLEDNIPHIDMVLNRS